jgi:hypothetical protein
MEYIDGITEAFGGLQLDLPWRCDLGQGPPCPDCVKFVAMTDSVRDSFHDILLSND